MSQEDYSTVRLLSYSELILALQGLCREKQSGVMIVSSESGGTAKLTLEQGEIFDVSFGGMSGKAALLSIKKIIQGKVSFFKRSQGNAVPRVDLSTTEILQTLADKAQTNTPPTPATTSSIPFQSANEEQMVVIEAILASIIGPVARIIYQDHREDIQRANDLDALGVVIEKIAKQMLLTEQQKVFKQNIRDFIRQSGFKEQKSILNAFNSGFKESKLNATTLSLCISKQAAQGELGAALLTKLALQIEYAGNLAGVVPLFDLLKFLEKTTKTGLLTIEAKGRKAAVYFEQGVLINASEANKHGLAVALDILQWGEPESMIFVALSHSGIVAREIHQTVAVLIHSLHTSIISKEEAQKYTKSDKGNLSANELQAALTKEITRLQDKAARKEDTKHTDVESFPLMAKAVILAEDYNNVGAEQLLSHILLEHDDHYYGWFWLARVSTSMTVIEFALKKAAYINSKSSELADEVKKFTAARKIVKSDFVLRCPFCWMPVKEKDNECSHCLSSFFVDREFFSKVGKAKTDALDKAISRYNNALQRDATNSGSIYLHHYLTMAYLNRQYYQEGLAQLNEIVSMLPENHAFIQQNALLTKYMRSEGLLSTTPVQQVNQNAATGKILIVEDSAVTRKVIARTLTASGYEVFEAKDANEALMAIEMRNFDLVLLDIILPGKDGYEILAEIRKMPRIANIPVVMLTSRDSLFDKIKGKVSDANEYLTKPFQPDELLLVVKKYLK
jgi:twitching motility two-component system response regulator PilG